MPTTVVDQTPSQMSRSQRTIEIRSLREVISSCDKLNLGESISVGASLESVPVVDSNRPSNTSWVGSFHDKMQAKSPGRYGALTVGTPIHKQLNFGTPVASKITERPSPTVSSVYSDRWCLESMTPGMRYTPPNMTLRGMRMNASQTREALGSYRMDFSAHRDNERGTSLCILPTPLLARQAVYNDAEFQDELSPPFGIRPTKPSPTIALGSPTPVGPSQKRMKPNSRHFPIPRPASQQRSQNQRRTSSTLSLTSSNKALTRQLN
jgi:hypothetical protein